MNVDVGKNMRLIRQEKGFSLRALAEASGLNVNTLSLIENGKSSPSVSTLQQLAQALRVPITAFFTQAQTPQQVVYQRPAERSQAVFSHGLLANLGAGMSHPGLEAFVITLDPGSDSGEEYITHTGRELVYCLEGEIHYQVGDTTYTMHPGDSLIFEAQLPHGWKNPGTEQACALLALCPEEPTGRLSQHHFD